MYIRYCMEIVNLLSTIALILGNTRLPARSRCGMGTDFACVFFCFPRLSRFSNVLFVLYRKLGRQASRIFSFKRYDPDYFRWNLLSWLTEYQRQFCFTISIHRCLTLSIKLTIVFTNVPHWTKNLFIFVFKHNFN
jgi:hypothetical protein